MKTTKIFIALFFAMLFSNVAFSQTYITVTSPTSSSVIKPGDSFTITWDTDISSGENVAISVFKGEKEVYTITKKTACDGSYTWTAPWTLTAGADYRIGINAANVGINDISNYFTIAPGIEVTSPVASSEWVPGESYDITWNDNFGDNVKIDLVRRVKIGMSYTYFYVTTISSTTASDGSFSWTVPWNISNSSYYAINISRVSDSSVTDKSGLFTIMPKVAVTNPTATAKWVHGQEYEITWNDNFTDSVSVSLVSYVPALRTYLLVRQIDIETSSDGSYFWTVPSDIEEGSYNIYVGATDGSVYDYSESFTIYTPNITITSPTASSEWMPGKTYEITWSDNIDDNVIIRLYIDYPKPYKDRLVNTIAAATASDGSYTWTVPEKLAMGTKYYISISGEGAYDKSENFTVTPILAVTSPTSSSEFKQGMSYDITWNDNFNDDVKIELYKGDDLVRTVSEAAPSSGSYNCTVATYLADGSDYRIRIINVGDGNIADYSEYFTISQSASIENDGHADDKIIAYPNPTDGEVFVVPNSMMTSDVKIAILNMTGHLLEIVEPENVGSDNTIKLNLSHLQSGIYFISLSNKDVNKVVKVILKK